jgi:hypothetical protein
LAGANESFASTFDQRLLVQTILTQDVSSIPLSPRRCFQMHPAMFLALLTADVERQARARESRVKIIAPLFICQCH